MTFEYVFKSILIGDSGVGKTSLCQQFCNKVVSSQHEPTIGVDFFSKLVEVEEDEPTHSSNNPSYNHHPPRKHILKLQLWDSAGIENFKPVIQSYYRNISLAFIVYDCTQRRTFKHVLDWLQDLRSHCDSNLVIVLVHNKADLHLQSQVSSYEAKALAHEHRMLFFETSSKVGMGVDTCFRQAAKELYRRIQSRQLVAKSYQPVPASVELAQVPPPSLLRCCLLM